MCLYPRIITNRKYIANKKNKGIVPEVKDKRTLLVPVGCQRCMECKKQKARQWSVRLQEEIRTEKDGQFVTLTFSNESIKHLVEEIAKANEGVIPDGYELDNAIATLATRRFLERWRKKTGKSIRHWLITELGQGANWKYQGTENVHLHGIIFSKDTKEIKEKWQYGHVFIGKYVNNKTINYITKYVTKTDPIHKEYNAIILTSKGIGSKYITRWDAQTNKFRGTKTQEYYTTRQGRKIDLPIYFRNKIYTDEEREILWIAKLDKQIRYVNGEKISIATPEGLKEYYNTLKFHQAKNIRLGYGKGKDWNRQEYERQRRNTLIRKRLEKAEHHEMDD